MNYKLNLTKNWKSYKNLLIYGSPLDTLGSPIDFLSISNSEDNVDTDFLLSIIDKIYGHYTMILISDSIVLIQDTIRSFPLFYSVKNNILEIYDQVSFDTEQLDYEQLEFFKAACFISGNKTILKGINQVQAGEIVFFNSKNHLISKTNYFHFDFFRKFSVNDNELILYSRLDMILNNVFQRFKQYSSGYKIVVPLSGGHDSRLILYYLKEIGFKDVITFSYGGKNSTQSERNNAQLVAESLGFEFHYIPYKRRKILKELKSTEYPELLKYVSSISSFPHLQDWYAIKYLMDNKIIDNNSIVVPGHTGDFVSGNHIFGKLIDEKNYSLDDVCKFIINKHMYHYVWKDKNLYEVFKKEIVSSIESLNIIPPFSNYEVIAIMDKYNFRERQSKMIVNSVRIYEWFNLKWYLPLWDRDFANFWMNLSIENLYGRHFFLYFAERKYSKLMQIAPVEFKKPLFDLNDITIRKTWLQNTNNIIRIFIKFIFFRSKIDKLALLEHFKLFELLKYIVLYQTTNQDFIWLNHLLEKIDITKRRK